MVVQRRAPAEGVRAGSRWVRQRAVRAGWLVAAVGLVAAGCGTATSSGGAGVSGGSSAAGSTLTIADFSPFSGPNAAYGAYEQAGCAPAVDVINANGGVLGHRLTCRIVDDRGDPADAIQAAQQLLATSGKSLIGIVDANSGVLTATVPIFNAAHLTDMSMGGDIPFDHNRYPYFWRTVPGDDVAGYALAAYIKYETKYSRIAAVFTNDQSAQGNVPGLVKGARNLGLHIVASQTLALDQTTYETEIQQLLASHPQVMASEMDAQSAGVYFGELKQAGGLLPGVLTSGTIGETWSKAVSAAISQPTLEHNYVQVIQFAPSTGVAFSGWKAALLASAKKHQIDGGSGQYLTSVFSEEPYDNVIMMALAMIASHSTEPATYNPYIARITSGSTIVHTFAQGKAALARGKTIDYVGVEGQVTFNRYHNSSGEWGVFQPMTNKLLRVIPASLVNKAQG